jgi:hypothetical protein
LATITKTYPNSAGWFQPMIKGRQYGKNVVDALKSGNATLINGIKNKFPNPKPNIENYHVVKEVRLSVTLPDGTKTYMKADAVLIDLNPDGSIKDVIIIENKLSQTTEFTNNQKAGWKKLKQDGKISLVDGHLNVEGISNKIEPPNGELSVPQGRVLKIADHGEPNVNNSTFEAVDLSNF